MVHIFGQTGVVRHGPLRIWAERGMVRIEDSRDNSYSSLSVKDCALRVKALSDMVKNTLSTDELFSYDEIIELQRVIDGYVSVMQRAREQGMPEDASARRDLARRRPKSIVVPNTVDMDL
jgi:uncharacterized protein (DUF2342 family)